MTDEPQPLGLDTLPGPLRERLAKMPPEPFRPDQARHAETAQEKADRLEARRQVYAARWAQQVPPMYQDATLADLDDAQAFNWPAESLNLVLAGPVGTGKTHAAYALGNALVADGAWVASSTVVDLLAALRPDGDLSLVRAAREAGVLILDDLGATKASEWAVEQMTALLDLRVREGRRTVFTTNVPEPDLETAWGGRFMDRLRFRRTVAVFRGESRRKADW
jgi:DNA replication protein DnaC